MRIPFFLCSLLIFFHSFAQPDAPIYEPENVKLTDSTKYNPVRDQYQSPTCWAFGTNSLFESDLLKQYNSSVDLSEMFLARYAYIDKAKTYLESGGTTYFEGGGQFHDVIRVIEKYGMVPEEVYNGRPNEQLSHDHARLDTSMQRYVKKLLAQGERSLSFFHQQQLEDTLDKYLGKVPAQFEYRTKKYTPKTFALELLKFKNDYVELVSFADKALYKRFELVDKYNWARDSFYNVTLNDLLMIVDTALHSGWSLGWEGDVTEPGFRYFGGFAPLPDSTHRYDQERLDNYRSEATERDHMLHIVGKGKDANNRQWYYTKNSWGNFSKYQGFIYMDQNYFKLKTVIIVVNKKGLPASIRKKLRIE